MGDASITATTAAVFIPEVWADDVVSAVEFASMIQKRCNRKYEKALKVGDTVNIPTGSNLTAGTKSMTTGVADTIAFEAITENNQTLVVNVMKYAAFLLEDATEVQSKYDLRSLYSKKIGYALARVVEVALAAMPQAFSGNSPIGSYGAELLPDDFISAWLFMAQAGLLENSPDPGEDFSLFVSPAAYADMLKTEQFINREQYNPQADAISRAKIGDVYGCPVYVSNLLRSPSAGQHDNFLMHRDILGLAIQKEVPVKSQYLIRNLADGIVGYSIYGTAEIDWPPETAGGGALSDNRGVLLKGK